MGIEDGRTALTVDKILAWADAHHAAHGEWPAAGPGKVSGLVAGAPGESWNAINHALALGLCGLPGDSSLAELLAEHRGAPTPDMGPQALADKIWAWEQEQFPVRGTKGRQSKGSGRSSRPLSVAEILAWADSYHASHGRWPTPSSGSVDNAPEESWSAIEQALRIGYRGLSGGTSLSKLLIAHHGPEASNRPRLTLEQIQTWAEAHEAATGEWPTDDSGTVSAAPYVTTWKAVGMALHKGGRGLPTGYSLARLRPGSDEARPKLTVALILEWADAHRASQRKWPVQHSGKVLAAPRESWGMIDHYLRKGGRGLPGGACLGHVLARHRGMRNQKQLPNLTIEQILAWADSYHAACGVWPGYHSGPVDSAPGETWKGIDRHLWLGRRGLPGGTTLLRLLVEHRGPQARIRPSTLSMEQIAAWAEAHRSATGQWPDPGSGPIAGAPGEDWSRIDIALQMGSRGLAGRAGGTTLPALMAALGAVRNRKAGPRLSINQILAWCDAHHASHGSWPEATSGPVADAPGETWLGIAMALYEGGRGLGSGRTLRSLLSARRQIRPRAAQTRRVQGPRTRLTVDQVLAWAKSHHAATGRWPLASSGPVIEVPGEQWSNIDYALRMGRRGLPGGLSLAQHICRTLDPAGRAVRPKLTIEQILVWASAHLAAHGRWPMATSDANAGAPGETWKNVDSALRHGTRGLPGGLSLRKLFLQYRSGTKGPATSS